MRRLLFGALLVGGCFNPQGNETEGGPGTGDTPAATSDPATAGTTTTTGTTAITTGGATTATLTTSGATTTVSATSDPTTGSGTASTGDTASSTTGDDTCEQPCGPCETCTAGACLQHAPNSPCVPAPGACEDTVWGAANKGCYLAAPTSGLCNAGGECKPVCDAQGPLLVECGDAACVLPGNACNPGAPAAGVTMDDFCASRGATTPDCTTVCHKLAGMVESYACEQGGACILQGSADCLGFTCDEQLLVCEVTCQGPLDCAMGYSCDLNMGAVCKPN